ncbi:GLPGLI family protein [Chryseobacterium zhengzhouense]|uniref:GLPGLI family protein n=1 Tax=Chryseobacterium zhengzhouense TaxID=1636086 RepID=A0ABW2LWY1_9FLAO
MKTPYFIFLLFFGVFVKSQSLKVDYDLVRNTTISTDKNFSSEFRDKILESEKQPEKYILYFINGNSFFKSLPTKEIQHENAPTKSGGTTTTLVEISVKQPVKVFKMKGDDKYFGFSSRDGKDFYKISRANFGSKVYKNDEQKIDKFICKLAEITNPSGTITKVWYTEDLPISTGPFAYGDFPGLVLKVETPTFVMYATKISETVNESEIERMDSKLPVID